MAVAQEISLYQEDEETDIERMQKRFGIGLSSHEKLVSKALSLLHMILELEEKGYTISAIRKNKFRKEVRVVRVKGGR